MSVFILLSYPINLIHQTSGIDKEQTFNQLLVNGIQYIIISS